MTKLKVLFSAFPASLISGLFLCTIIFSCSQSQYQPYKTPPRPSLKTWQGEAPDLDSEEEFMEIEKSRAIKHYREQREWARENPQKFRQKRLKLYRKARERAREEREKEKQEQPQQVKKSPQKKTKRPAPLTKDKKIEIHQNIRYFCIQNEDRGPWDKVEECVSFGKSKVQTCREKTKSASSQTLIKCLKAQLK